MDCSTPGFPVHHQLLKLAQTHVHWVGDAIQPSHPLSSPSPPAFNLPSIGVFSNESALRIRWPKYWSFSFSISSSNEYSGLISFRMDWLDLLAVQGTLKSLLQRPSSKASKTPRPIPWQLLVYFLYWRICLLVCIQSLSQVLLFAAPCSISSVQFSRSVGSDSLWPHESRHARPPCPSPTPGVHSDSSPSSQWCHSAISSSVVPFSFCPQSLPASESFPMSQLFAWGGQSTGVSALAS